MLVQLTDYIKRESNLSMPYIGVVVDNKDPLQRGRIKCNVEGLFTGESEKLPWIYPHNSSLFGGVSNQGIFFVPEIGAKLIIEFPYDDIYAGFYTGFLETEQSHVPDFNTDYPDTYGMVDSTGNKILVNKKQGTIELTHKSGTKLTIADSGEVLLSGVADVKVDTTGQIFLNGGEEMSKVLTVESEEVIDFITGVPCVGVARVKAGLL